MPRWIALCFAFILVSSATAAPVPKPVLDRTENERLWTQLQNGTSIELTEAVCRFLVHPESTVPFFATKLKPLTMTKKQVVRSIGLLDSDNGWKGGYEELTRLDPRLALSIADCWALAKSDVQKRRLAWILNEEMIEGTEECDFELEAPKDKNGMWQMSWKPKPGVPPAMPNFGFTGVCKDIAEIRMSRGRPKWFAETQAVTLLSRLNTPAAWKVIEPMATGHKDAAPTIYAVYALENRTRGKFAPGYAAPKYVELRPADDPKSKERFRAPMPEEILRDENRKWWNSLDFMVAYESKIEAILDSLRRPTETVAFFKTELRPLKLEKKRADQLVSKLFGEKEADWKAAVAEFAKLDIRLAYSVADAWDLAKTDDQRTKIAMVLLHDGPKHSGDLANFEVRVRPVVPMRRMVEGDEREKNRLYFELELKPNLPKELAERLSNHRISTYAPGHFDELNELLWNREACAIHILDAIGTTEALAIIKEMATGHPDATPTKVAKVIMNRR